MFPSIAIVCAFVFVACGRSDKTSQDTTEKKPAVANKNKQPATQKVTPEKKDVSDKDVFIQRLSRTWSTKCVSAGPDSSSFQIVAMTFTADQLELKGTLFTDAECRNGVFSVVYQGKNTVVEPAKNHPAGYLTNTTFLKASYSVLSELEVKAYNESRFCGLSDWKIGEPRDVSGRDCVNDLSNKPITSVVEISGNQLTIMSDSKGESKKEIYYSSDKK